ncbi:hypothetical protein [Rhodococcus sp. NPDC055024]
MMLQNVTDLDQWKSRAEADISIDTGALIDGIAARAPWADRDYDILSHSPSLCGVATSPISIPLSRHKGVLGSSDLKPAHVDVQLVQRGHSTEPTVVLERWETTPKMCFTNIAGSIYRLSLDEAVQLAHTLLLAADVARGASNDEGSVSA